MDLNLKSNVVVVSGGAKGIGESIVRLFAGQGANVLFIDNDTDAGFALMDSLKERPGKVIFVDADLSQVNVCMNAIKEAVNEFGRLDVLVNNAGQNDYVGLTASTADFLGSIKLNLVHCFELVKYAEPYLKSSKGRIINIASKVAQTGQGNTSGYAASKGALLALTREWAVDFASSGVTVNAVVPAEVLTPMYERALKKFSDPTEAKKKVERSIPLEQRMTVPEEIANTVLFLASPLANHITGQHIYVDGGYTHLDRMYTPQS